MEEFFLKHFMSWEDKKVLKASRTRVFLVKSFHFALKVDDEMPFHSKLVWFC